MTESRYLEQLIAALREEASNPLLAPAVSDRTRRTIESGDLSLSHYRTASECLASDLDRVYVMAQPYSTMEEFWDDAKAQEEGATLNSYWDSYENGLRRIREAQLAEAYGSRDAVLVNSGMSAIDVALRSSDLKAGDLAILPTRTYFETEDYFHNIFSQTGAITQFVDMDDARQLTQALCKQPSLIYLETVENGPQQSVPDITPLRSISPDTVVVIDNSVVSHGLRWEDISGITADIVVIESGSKYITRSASAGVLYTGTKSRADSVRLTARRIGQQLQGRAINRIRYADIITCAERLRIHRQNVQIFEETIYRALGRYSIKPNYHERDDDLSNHYRRFGIGATSYFAPTGQDADPQALRRIVNWWAAETKRVRAGFGWDETTARAYAADKLNTSKSPSYIRLSIGLEEIDEIVRIGTSFAQAVKHTISNWPIRSIH